MHSENIDLKKIKYPLSFSKIAPWRIAIAMVVLLLLIALAITYLTYSSNKNAYKLDFSIEPVSAVEKLLQVNLSVKNLNLTNSSSLELFNAAVDSFDEACFDSKGNKIEFSKSGNFIKINCGSNEYINFTYKVKIGKPGKHGYAGQYYDDLLTFSGEQALILPTIACIGTDEEIKKSIENVSITYLVPKDRLHVIPFEGTGDSGEDKLTTIVTDPTWSNFYDLRKSCFAFGNFNKQTLKNGKGMLDIYTDPLYTQIITEDATQGINSIYQYYSKLFGFEIPKLSIVILRKDSKDNSYLMGGVSSQTIGSTFSPDNARDWELLSHRIFHAFFDSKVTSQKFHVSPQLWFYEGLATYYENMSMDSLPESIRSNLGLGSSNSLLELSKRYVYMRLKDQFTLAITPMDEGKLTESEASIEFLHYTQAPLLIKMLEDVGYSKYQARDRMLKYIISSPLDNSLRVEDICKYTLGENTDEFLQNYINGNQVMPVWNFMVGKPEDARKVIEKLNEYEYTLWTWFRLENQQYPLDKLSIEGMDAIWVKAQREDAHFATDEIESKLADFSPTVNKLLMQYALSAQVCGVDYSDPLLRYRLLNNPENKKKWENYKAELVN